MGTRPTDITKAGQSGASSDPASHGGLADLVAEARRLTKARHPGAGKAWARVRAAGADLPADVAAEAERARAGDLMHADPAAAVPLLADVAGQFAALGDTDRELEALASAAAARWDGVSESDALHAAFTAARAYAALDRHGEAAALFAQAISKVDDLYGPPEAAMTHDQYGRSLHALGQHKEAAEQFLLALGLLAGDSRNAGPHAMLAALAAEELQRSGQLEAARSAFLKAADLMGALGAMGRRARCLRAAAWLEFDAEGDAEGTESSRPSVARMRAVLAELAEQPQTAEIDAETAETRRQLAAMLGDE